MDDALAKKEAGIVKKDFDPFQAMDALDDKAILAEMEGRITDTWVYHFNQQGQEIWGLSKVGIDAACREMAKMGEAIREEDVNYQVDPTNPSFILFKASASRVVLDKSGNEIVLDRAFGTKRQGIKQYNGKPNPFWFEQGTIKALRNARARLLSEEVRARIMALAKGKGKVTEISKPKDDTKTTNYKFLQEMKKQKERIGEESYYKVLGQYGVEHANEIPQREVQKDVYTVLKNQEGSLL